MRRRAFIRTYHRSWLRSSLAPVVVIVSIALLVLLASTNHAAAQSKLDQQVRHVASQLRCPVCQNESVADSPSQVASEMRQLIRQKLKQGQSEQQILDYFAKVYGSGILMDPPKRGFGLLAWAQPVLVILIGLGLIGFGLNRWIKAKPSQDLLPQPSDEEVTEYDEALRADLNRYQEEKG